VAYERVKLTYLFRGAQVFPKSQNYFQIQGDKKVTFRKFHIEDPQMLGATVNNLVTTGFVFCTTFLYDS
jgi:hypothetical protein